MHLHLWLAAAACFWLLRCLWLLLLLLRAVLGVTSRLLRAALLPRATVATAGARA